MFLFLAKYRLLGWISLILVTGFLATGVAGYIASRDAIESGIAEQALPLTGDNIYSEIQKDMLRPVFISSLMAHDTFVRDWILGGEKTPDQVVRYLAEVKKKYATVSSFLISESSRKYYYAGGTLKSVQPNEPRDAWYFRVRAMHGADYETNVDHDQANRDSMTIFINHRVLDYDGKFIGVTGVGLTLDTMAKIIDRYQARFQRDIYFVDNKGVIVLAGKAMRKVRGSLHQLPGVSSIAPSILNGSAAPTRLSYSTPGARVLVNSRFIPELGWYLVVEQNVTAEVRPLQRTFVFNLAISALVTALVLTITLLTVNRYQRRLERLASTDALTGLLNRQALEVVFRQAILQSRRTGRPLAAILFDIDYFKKVNDSHGHLAGDTVLRQVARIAQDVVRESDVVTRWGGEEYLVLLGDCNLQQAGALAETLRKRIAEHDFGLPDKGQRVTVSAGIAQFEQGETESAFFTRADVALYAAKNAGRNRTQLSEVRNGRV